MSFEEKVLKVFPLLQQLFFNFSVTAIPISRALLNDENLINDVLSTVVSTLVLHSLFFIHCDTVTALYGLACFILSCRTSVLTNVF